MVRRVTAEDVELIAQMSVDYYHENQAIKPYDVDFDIDVARANLTVMIQQPSAIGYVSDDGYILGELRRMWFGKDVFGYGGAGFYVRPPARNGLLARRLMNAFCDEAKSRGAKYCVFSLFNDVRSEMLDGFFIALGCQPQGSVYLKEVA
jgi:GNAT superfamily N-acetyltransferase